MSKETALQIAMTITQRYANSLFDEHTARGRQFMQEMSECLEQEREQIKAVLPSKDDAVNVGFRKAINADYKLRKVCKDSDDDLYYSGWMDCYDWLNETYKGGEQ